MPGWTSLFPVLTPSPIARPEILAGPQGPAGSASSHAAGCYYVNAVTGEIQRQCNPLNASLLAPAGFMGKGWVPATPFNAFDTFEEAQAFANEIAPIRGGISGIGGGSAGVIGGAEGKGAVGVGSGSGGSSGGTGSGSDWQHLMVRFAEFGIGAILVIIGFNAIVSRTKGYQRVETVVTGVAGKVPK